MKKFTKTLSIVLLIAMCVSMFTVSAFAEEPAHAADCAQTLKKVPAVAASCTETGMSEYYICPCGHVYADEAGANYLSAMPVVAALGHSIQQVPADAATCARDGVKAHAKCTTCNKLFNSDCTVEVTAADTVEAKLTTHNFVGIAPCSVCGEGNPNHNVFVVTGTNPAEFSNTGVYVYEANHKVTGVSADGYPLYEGQGFYYANGKVTVNGSAIASIIGSKSSVELVFTAEDACTVGGFTLNNQTTVETLRVDGFEQKGFIKGSTEAVSFQTNDANPNNVELYYSKTQNFVSIPAGGYTMNKVGNMYTYTFTKGFLDTLEAGTYYVRCYYSDSKYVTAGTITINLSNATTTGDSNLSFTNSTVSNTEYKYVSGGAGPKLYSELFRDSASKLQISTNGGTSWKDVSVYDYYVEQSNNKDTSYAWIKTAYLDGMPASSNVYFRVIVPASERGASTDAISNWVKITTGNTLAAVDTNKHVINSSKSLKFVSSAKIDEVYVGNINLTATDPDAFKVSADGKYVTLYADFLNARTAGSTYTLTVVTEDGEKLSTTFQILTTAQASASPRTGDDSNIALWSAFLMLSGAAVVAVLPRLKKEQ